MDRWVVGAIWLALLVAVLTVGVVFLIAPPDSGPIDGASCFFSFTLPQWTPVLSTGFLVCVGLYVVTWMHFRRVDP